MLDAVHEAQEEHKSVKASTERTIETGRNDVKEIKNHVDALTREVNELSKQRDALHVQIQRENIQQEKELQVNTHLEGFEKEVNVMAASKCIVK